MSRNVAFHIRTQPELLSADWTPVRFLSRMHAVMSSEIRRRSEFLSALITLVGPLSGVYLSVHRPTGPYKQIGLKGTPGYRNKGIFQDRLCVDNSKDTSKNLFCAIAEFQLIIFELKGTIINMIHLMRPIQPISSYPITEQIHNTTVELWTTR